jgi:hypothetical protein
MVVACTHNVGPSAPYYLYLVVLSEDIIHHCYCSMKEHAGF